MRVAAPVSCTPSRGETILGSLASEGQSRGRAGRAITLGDRGASQCCCAHDLSLRMHVFIGSVAEMNRCDYVTVWRPSAAAERDTLVPVAWKEESEWLSKICDCWWKQLFISFFFKLDTKMEKLLQHRKVRCYLVYVSRSITHQVVLTQMSRDIAKPFHVINGTLQLWIRT